MTEDEPEDNKYKRVFNNHRVEEGTVSANNPELYLKPLPSYQIIVDELVAAFPEYQWVLGNRECK